MTLKEFAADNGIGYNLAKQWKKRGKIVTEGDGYRLVTLPRPRGVSPLGVVTEDDPGRMVTPKEEAEKVTVTLDLFNKWCRELRELRERVARLESENRELRQLWIETEAKVLGIVSDLNRPAAAPRRGESERVIADWGP